MVLRRKVPVLCSLAYATRRLGISRHSAGTLLRLGRLRSIKIGRRIFVSRADVNALANAFTFPR
jgi:hypothetical protein